MAEPTSTLHDISDPGPLLPGIHVPVWIWALATLAAAALVLLVVFLLRRPKPGPASLEEIYDQSRKELECLRGCLDRLPLAAVATEASLSIRRYLAACLGEPALYETHEEFLLRDEALAELPAGSREHLNPLLTRLAELKYGPSAEDVSAAGELINQCLTVLQGLESTRPRPLA